MPNSRHKNGFVLAQVMVMMAMASLLIFSVSRALDQQMATTRQLSLRQESLEACRYFQEHLWTATLCRRSLQLAGIVPHSNAAVATHDAKIISSVSSETQLSPLLLDDKYGSGFRQVQLDTSQASVAKVQAFASGWTKTFSLRNTGGSTAGFCQVRPVGTPDWNVGLEAANVVCAPNPNMANPTISTEIRDFNVAGSPNRSLVVPSGTGSIQLEFVRENVGHGVQRVAVYNRTLSGEFVDAIQDNAIQVDVDVRLKYAAGTDLAGSTVVCPVSANVVLDRATQAVLNCVDVADPLADFCAENGGTYQSDGSCTQLNPRKTDYYCQVAETLGLLDALPKASGAGARFDRTLGRCVR